MTQSTLSVTSFADAPVSEQHAAQDAARVIEGAPRHTTRSYFESADGSFSAGTWECTPGKWRALTGKDELCYIVKGHLRLISDTGQSRTFKTGDTFVIPDGFIGFWEVLEPTIKHYAVRKY
ncbi:MAG: cupin domain-containing protein [Pigmentiphaga sp.]|uniref:cupin domain-containing protein n=1 Tax=Pandoraea pnomenusa TaxID=93220 RepID=UPI001AC34E9F|nr:cupin domain-containing protein [Pandoraea pnomenusa]MBN9091758.1 cupin domain-containing protein [Pandoraea pnomenusa]